MCDPILQLGCMAGEKCTWITRGSYIGCARDGTAQLGATCACTLTEGIDGCARGLVCGDTIVTSTCLLICDLNGQLPPACPTGTACLATGFAFTRDGDHAAGLCR